MSLLHHSGHLCPLTALLLDHRSTLICLLCYIIIPLKHIVLSQVFNIIGSLRHVRGGLPVACRLEIKKAIIHRPFTEFWSGYLTYLL